MWWRLRREYIWGDARGANPEPINPLIQRMRVSRSALSPTDGSRGGDGCGGAPREKSRGAGRRRFLLYEAHLHAEPAHSFGSAGGSALGASSDVPGFSPGFPSFLASACFCAARSSILALYSLAVCLKLSFASAALACAASLYSAACVLTFSENYWAEALAVSACSSACFLNSSACTFSLFAWIFASCIWTRACAFSFSDLSFICWDWTSD